MRRTLPAHVGFGSLWAARSLTFCTNPWTSAFPRTSALHFPVSRSNDCSPTVNRIIPLPGRVCVTTPLLFRFDCMISSPMNDASLTSTRRDVTRHAIRCF